MSEVIPFMPRHEFDAKKNLGDFIKHCKENLFLYGPDLVWDALRWNVSAWHRRRGKNDRKAEMVFSSLGSTKSKTIPMNSEYADFAKAYMRHTMTFSGEKHFANTLTATRILEKALIACSQDGVPKVYLTNITVADEAIRIIEEQFESQASRYQYGWRFQKLISFLVEKRLVATPFEWKCPFRPPEVGTLIGEEHEKRRAEKLPSRDTLAAVGTIFDRATEDRDVIVSSCFAILCSAPGRVCEAVTMQNHCEVLLKNADGTEDLELRWYPAKGGTEGGKPILKEMEPVVRKAIEKVRAISEEARKMALWYEKNPDKLYLPEGMEHIRNKETINGEELAQIFGWNPSCSPKNAAQHGLTIHKTTAMLPNRWRKDGTRSYSKTTLNLYSFKEVEQRVLSYLPPGFPWMDEEHKVKYSNALFVVRRGTFSCADGIMSSMFMGVSLHTVLAQFAGQTKDKNIFMRFGFKNPDGSRMRMTTHQARHWLNTIAERGGLSDLERDMWSGRVTGSARKGEPGPTGRQSLAYLHNTAEELMKAANLDAEEMDMDSSFASVVGKLPVSFEEFKAMENKPTVHVTEYGVCFHDFALQPCKVHADCLNCMEHAFIKGDKDKAQRIRECRKIAVEQIEMAAKLVAAKYLKAEPWFHHQSLTVKRLTGLLELLNDDGLPPETIIMLVNPFQYSAFRNAIEDRAVNVGDDQSIALAEAFKMSLLHVIENIQNLLPGGVHEASV